MDVRHKEFKARTDAVLGQRYDQGKLDRVEELQATAQNAQTKLYQQFANGHLNPTQYVHGVNENWDVAFLACKQILGAVDFAKLFDTGL